MFLVTDKILKNLYGVMINYSWVQSLVGNHPTIIFFNPDLFEIRPEAEEYFNDLKRVEILFDDPRSAAQKVEKIYDNVGEWWLSNRVQTARKKFVNQYANTKKIGRLLWQRF